MKQTFDTDTILYKTLKSASITLSGDVYKVTRPLNSSKEDIVVNTIVLTQEYYPQIGTSNVNIHVPDKNVTIDNVAQKVRDDSRMQELSTLVFNAIRSTVVKGLNIYIENQTVIEEAEISQHYVNLRIRWYIIN